MLALTVADNFVDHGHFDKSIKADSQLRVQNLMAKINLEDKNTILSYEPDTIVKHQIYFQLDAMLAAQTLGIKTLNGYTATSPKGFDAYWRLPNEASRRVWLSTSGLDSTHIQVVH